MITILVSVNLLLFITVILISFNDFVIMKESDFNRVMEQIEQNNKRLNEIIVGIKKNKNGR